jgi:hypothetical protein
LPSVAISVNREYAELDRALREGDEVALLPPVSGGAPGADRIQDEVRDEVRSGVPGTRFGSCVSRSMQRLSVRRLRQPSDGAVVIFNGVVRNNTRGRRTLYLDYEAYEAMALRQMESLAAEARGRFAVRGRVHCAPFGQVGHWGDKRADRGGGGAPRRGF